MPVIGTPIQGVPLTQAPTPQSDKSELVEAVEAIVKRLQAAKRPVAFVGYKVHRYGLQNEAQKLIEALNIPFVATPMDKAVLSEAHPLYAGLYKGHFLTDPVVKEIVEGADLVLDIGEVVFDDLSQLGAARIDHNKQIILAPNCVTLPQATEMVHCSMNSFNPVFLGDILKALVEQTSTMKKFDTVSIPPAVKIESADPAGVITYGTVHAAMHDFFQTGDIFVCETGTSSVQFSNVRLPDGVTYHNQTLWGSIGWATPAALGTALAVPDRRTILITGDGSHQLTATEIGTMGKYGTNPIVICMNNDVFGIEEFLERNDHCSYNDLARWEYTQLPAALGCKNWFIAKVSTNEELVRALNEARNHTSAGTYIQVVLGVPLLPPLDVNGLHLMYQEKNPDYNTL